MALRSIDMSEDWSAWRWWLVELERELMKRPAETTTYSYPHTLQPPPRPERPTDSLDPEAALEDLDPDD